MSLDQTTESIAHFIGLFHLAENEARLRTDYYEFKFKQKLAETGEFEFKPVENKAPLELDKFNPHLKYTPSPEALLQVTANGSLAFPAQNVSPDGDGAGADYSDSPVPIDAGAIVNFFVGSVTGGVTDSPTILPYIPLPSSAITVTIQTIHLDDNDVIGDVVAAGFQSLDGLYAALETAIDLAEGIQPWSTEGLMAEVLEDPGNAQPFIEMINELEDPDIDGLNVTIIEDEDTEGVFVNGELVDEVPELEDQLPAFIKAKRDKLNDDEDGDQLAGFQKDKAILDTGNDAWPTVINAEHNVSAGANEAHNHANIQTSSIDAGVIAVAGDVINLNAVSQVNVLYDTDQYHNTTWNDPNAPSQAYNIASTQVDNHDIPDGFEIEAAATTDLPSNWHVVRLDGDLTVTNYIQQHTFVMDSDQLDLTFSANSTTIVTGENLTFNLGSVAEFGFGYDLIFVGGTMLSMNVVNQTNVLLDNDQFYGAGISDAAISGHDNLLRNEASIHQEGIDTQVAMLDDFNTALENLKQGVDDLSATVAQNAYFEGLDQLKVLYIDGHLTQLNIVDQINYMGDMDQVHMALDSVQSALDDVPVAITTGSNMLTNTASINQTGFDSNVMAGGNYYSDALLYQAELIDTDANPAGVGMTGLTSEAVAFLADDMIADAVSDSLESAGIANDAHTGGTALDVMQTMTT